LEQETAMTTIATTHKNPTAPHVFDTATGPAHLINPDGTTVTTTQFVQHHRVLTGIANRLDAKGFGHETCRFKLVPVQQPQPVSTVDLNTLSTDELRRAAFEARLQSDVDAGGEGWADLVAGVLENRLALEAADLEALPTNEECARDLQVWRDTRDEAEL
jgi:hypothetical protein